MPAAVVHRRTNNTWLRGAVGVWRKATRDPPPTTTGQKGKNTSAIKSRRQQPTNTIRGELDFICEAPAGALGSDVALIRRLPVGELREKLKLRHNTRFFSLITCKKNNKSSSVQTKCTIKVVTSARMSLLATPKSGKSVSVTTLQHSSISMHHFMRASKTVEAKKCSCF